MPAHCIITTKDGHPVDLLAGSQRIEIGQPDDVDSGLEKNVEQYLRMPACADQDYRSGVHSICSSSA